MVQYLVVAAIVAAAVLYSAWTLMPAAWRRAGAAKLAARSGLAPEAARDLQLRLERAGTCSECASCKGCAKGAPARD